MNMKILPGFLLFVSLSVVSAHALESDFLRSLTPEQRESAGLSKLSPEELARLDRLLLERDAARTAASPVAATPVGGKRPNWLTALITLEKTNREPDAAEAIESRLVGDYDGWSGRTSFKLENGQIWQQVSGGQRIDKKRSSPAVKVYPGVLGAYWLEVEGIRERVKVKPVKLE